MSNFKQRNDGGILLGIIYLLMLHIVPAYAASVTEENLPETNGYQSKSDSQAIKTLTKSAQEYACQGRVKDQVKTLLEIARIYQMNGHTDKAGAVLDTATTAARQSTDKSGVGWVLSYQGNLETAAGHSQKALQSFEESLSIARDIKDIPHRTDCGFS